MNIPCHAIPLHKSVGRWLPPSLLACECAVPVYLPLFVASPARSGQSDALTNSLARRLAGWLAACLCLCLCLCLRLCLYLSARHWAGRAGRCVWLPPWVREGSYRGMRERREPSRVRGSFGMLEGGRSRGITITDSIVPCLRGVSGEVCVYT